MGSRLVAALVAAATLSLALAAVASAEAPKWYECAKEAGGKYEKGCEKEGGSGGFVIRPGIGKGKEFKGKGTDTDLHIVGYNKRDVQIKCGYWKVTGLAAAPNRMVDVKLAFTQCEKFANGPCWSGEASGVIETVPLAGQLGWIGTGDAGVALTDEAAPNSGYLAEFECQDLGAIRIHGAMIGSISSEEPFGKAKRLEFDVGEFLGEVEGHYPIVNPPEFLEGYVGTLLTEVTEEGLEFVPEGGLPSGLEADIKLKGEALAIR